MLTVVKFGSIPTPPIWAYYTNFVISDDTEATAVWPLAALEFFLLPLMLFSSFPSVMQLGTTVLVSVRVTEVAA